MRFLMLQRTDQYLSLSKHSGFHNFFSTPGAQWSQGRPRQMHQLMMRLRQQCEVEDPSVGEPQ